MAVALFMAGCVPREILASPEIDGHVIDENTGVPIAGATVSTHPTSDPDQGMTATTDDTGHFHIQAATREIWAPIMFDPAGPMGLVTVKADGYEVRQFDFYQAAADGGYRVREVFKIRR